MRSDMPPMTESLSVSFLRMVTQRLSTTLATQLPHVAAFLAASITNSRKAFITSQHERSSKSKSEIDVLIHKLKTQLSAMLQDRSPHARFSAVVLIKATIEVGGWDVLQEANPWVRGMISIMGVSRIMRSPDVQSTSETLPKGKQIPKTQLMVLIQIQKPDSPASKKLCIVVLTRIFLLTHEHQSLLRDITTPSLAPFITACLNAVKSKPSSGDSHRVLCPSPLLLVVIQSFSELIALHPTSFRPFVSQIRTLLLPLIAATPSDIEIDIDSPAMPERVVLAARHLYALLHVCAPKNTAAEEWSNSVQNVIAAAQRTMDRVFRCVIEEWRPRTERNDIDDLSIGEVVSDRKPQPLALPAWKGIHAGIERLNGLFGILQAFISSTTSIPVAVPISDLISFVKRTLSVLQPGCPRGPRTRLDIFRDEREGVEIGVSQLHVASLDLLSSLVYRLGNGSIAIMPTILERVLWVLNNERADDGVKAASYRFLSQVLTMFGPTLPISLSNPISRSVRLCCEDLLPTHESSLQDREILSSRINKQPSKEISTTNSDSYLKGPIKTAPDASHTSAIVIAAGEKLLPLMLTNLPSGYLPFFVRTLIDRTAILTGDKELMLASVMNPPPSTKGRPPVSSILPMLARAHNGETGIEALLRPQMPIMEGQRKSDGEPVVDLDEDDRRLTGLPNEISEGTMFAGGALNIDGPGPGTSNLLRESPAAGDEDNEISVPATNGGSIQDTGPRPFISDFHSNPTKRDQDTFLSQDAEPGSLNVEDKAPAGEEATSKRVRLSGSEADQALQEEHSVKDLPAIYDQQPAVTVSQSPLVGNSGEAQIIDSDSSGFEMPELHLSTDTDDDDEDDGEDDE